MYTYLETLNMFRCINELLGWYPPTGPPKTFSEATYWVIHELHVKSTALLMSARHHTSTSPVYVVRTSDSEHVSNLNFILLSVDYSGLSTYF